MQAGVESLQRKNLGGIILGNARGRGETMTLGFTMRRLASRSRGLAAVAGDDRREGCGAGLQVGVEIFRIEERGKERGCRRRAWDMWGCRRRADIVGWAEPFIWGRRGGRKSRALVGLDNYERRTRTFVSSGSGPRRCIGWSRRWRAELRYRSLE
jgi:hypothetical protein